MNPFRFGNIVSGEYFTGREEEIKEIIAEINSGQHMVLISPRRYGKSSLINKVLDKIKNQYCFIDMELLTDELDFANYYIKKILSLSKIEKIKEYFKGIKIQPQIQFKPDTNDFSISFSYEQSRDPNFLRDTLELAEIISKKQKKKFVIVFDEFQDIRRISKSLEKKMRGIFQYHQNVTYIFIGSQESIIRDIFQNKKNPFYRFTRQIILSKISRDVFKKFILKRFVGKKIDVSKIVEDILNITDCHPYYTQQLCHEIYMIYIMGRQKRIIKEIVTNAIEKIICQHNADYTKWWSFLNNNEKKVVIGVIKNYQLMSQHFIREYGITSASTVNSIIKKLTNNGVLIKNNDIIDIEDPFWKEWIRKWKE